jgi:hypothetical protein
MWKSTLVLAKHRGRNSRVCNPLSFFWNKLKLPVHHHSCSVPASSMHVSDSVSSFHQKYRNRVQVHKQDNSCNYCVSVSTLLELSTINFDLFCWIPTTLAWRGRYSRIIGLRWQFLGGRGKELSGWEAYFPAHEIGEWLQKNCLSKQRNKHCLSTLREQTAKIQPLQDNVCFDLVSKTV